MPATVIAKPLGSRVLLKEKKREETSKGGIYVPSVMSLPYKFGVVAAVGSGYVTNDGTRVPVEADEGDTVLFHAGAGIEVELGPEREKFLVVDERDILLVSG